jgi:tyrosyl-tRNA synthetase
MRSRPGGSAAPAPKLAAPATPAASAGDDWRFQLLFSVGEECQTEAELRALLQRRPEFNLYDGFEPSGRMHIAQGVFKAINVNKCTKAGGTFIFWVADWFALMNDKMGGDLEKIKTCGKYLIEVWKAGGMDMSRVKFLWSSDEISEHAKEYWGQALDIARRSTLTRIKRCGQIMGRKDDSLTCAQILYPIMQCTDIFYLKADICQLGVDQRKVNMLAREYCDASGRKNKPIILSHHMLYGLKAGQSKMSKSDPDSAIFMEDTREDVERKIRQAFCPAKPEAAASASTPAAEDDEMHLVKDDLKNPCLDYVKHILFVKEGYSFKAGDKEYTSHAAVKQAFVSGELSEDVLKSRIIEEVNALLEPVRQHFENDATAKELLRLMREYKKEALAVTSSLTRLMVVAEGSAPVFAVFAPMPSEFIQLDSVLGVIQRLRSAPSGHQSILWLEDWSATTLGRAGGSAACIEGFYELFLFALRTLAPEVMQQVRVCWQGAMILTGPNQYWISVINAGRKTSLDQLKNRLPPGETLDNASQVVAGLMHVGDVLSLPTTGSSAPILCSDAYHENLHGLAREYLEGCGLPPPEVRNVPGPGLRLLPEGDGVEVDVNLYLTDKEIDVNKKMKKSFCEPGNVGFCPPISLVGELLAFRKEFVITRKPENGGDKSYTDLAALREDYASGSLHPGDLKPAVQKAINAFYEDIRTGLKDNDVLKKAVKDLENYAKAQQKKK